MHRKTPISVLVYNALFPTPTPTDPPSFSAHLSKNLVGEVRIETANFYGSLDTIEARYPGLNYASAPHRKRLGRFPHHRRLFAAFDSLGLTEAEIQGFCRWEGTLWARERYERDEGVRVVDTTGREIGGWVDNRHTLARAKQNSRNINVQTEIEVEITAPVAQQEMAGDEDAEMSDEEEGEEEEVEVVALEGQPMDPEWEQYLKEAQERGELNIDATREAMRLAATRPGNGGGVSEAAVA